MSTTTFRHEHLVLTVSYSSGSYELLVEVDTDEGAATVPVLITTADGTIAEVDL